MNRLDPRIVTVWRAIGVARAAVATAVAAALEFLVLLPEGVSPVPAGTLTALVALAGVVLGIGWPVLRYRVWRWSIEPDRVVIQYGVLWRSRAVVPRVRIQHVDTRDSPLQRWLGISTLTIYTAGTRGADVAIPGLAADTAEELRDDLGRLEELEVDA